ncbi:hypothetical protein EIP91_009941 [Steccherinum ochraceum]|uniref:NAD(P)-binding domain-containing protein n=1 Tax=Steccherinum ochraceum TaxID=92696 RepID=A0A4R0RDG6_9APHY|nr:hypothetical protein EIP91_009941 [Steccherinum ochraceum]
MPSWAVLPPNAPTNSTTILHSDFTSYSPDLVSTLKQHDACIWTLGVSASGRDEAEFIKITNEFPMALASALKAGEVGEGREAGKPFRFVWFSGASADETEKSMAMSPRIKGKTENDITKLCEETPGMQAYILRPGGFHPSTKYPEDTKHQRGKLESVAGNVLWPVLRLTAPSLLISAEQVSAAALAVAKGMYAEQKLFNNKQLLEIANRLGVTVKA